jgi:hypothetical protein
MTAGGLKAGAFCQHEGTPMKRLATRLILPALAMATLGLAACNGSSTAPTASAPSAAAAADSDARPYNTKLEVKQFMAHAIDPIADAIWEKQGWVIDAAGEHELFPTTDLDWTAQANASVALSELGNALLLPGRGASDEKRWQEYAAALNKMALRQSDAATKKDKQAFFDAGGQVYEVCKDCHQKYILGEDNAPPPPQ